VVVPGAGQQLLADRERGDHRGRRQRLQAGAPPGTGAALGQPA
jgi:hypothetical protein